MKYRISSLDALRGLAILLMIFSGRVPWNGALPGWMYHAQLPPPTNKFNPNFPGITWVDLVFPFFLFAMGCAIPLALNKKISNNTSIFKILFDIFKRTFLLIFFAIFLQHTKPYVISSPDIFYNNIIALIALIAMFFIFGDYKGSYSDKLTKYRIFTILKIIGWLVAFYILYSNTYKDGSGFKLSRNDIIILVIADNFLFASLIWLITKENILLRVAILIFFIALRISSTVPESWINILWKFDLIKDIFIIDYLKYLIVILPGTIIGDLITKFDKNTAELNNTQWNKSKYISLMFLYLSFVLVSLIGFYSRYIFITTIILVLLAIVTNILLKNINNDFEKLIANSSHIAIFLIVLGAILEPLQGGIKKDPATFNYLILTTGLAIATLMLFTILFDYIKFSKYFGILIDNGKNPLIAYTGHSHILWPLLSLTGIDIILNNIFVGPFLGTVKAFLLTLLVA
ncbi:MAG TPA: DUF5009 domain-containing protein [Ignavibacteriales bacterium]|nr:DUF5009 domain-containing protein [Ignavibacteriales bacterium]HOL81302.1 DUF5009 domain-containing protein [Ignavibacteriales bacterium]HOM66042.1 DUF5009 domain-containing protein [Ignavibacteriales bacterium]HPD67534.1 DUF5009 domain-containing protein [Ignavibacteriales bacterium]HPP33412.1 DUF5009 domain-containing protein [Ignavibacteriales bacterium]